MKVVFKVIKTGSGNDIYFQSLTKMLSLVNIDSEIIYYHQFYQYFPLILKLFNKPTNADVIHSNVEYAWVFKEKDKPLYASLFHNVLDKEYEKYSSFAQKIYYHFILKPNIKKSLVNSDKLIAISKYTKKSFIKTYGNFPIEVIYCAIDTDKFKPRKVVSKDKRFKLLFVGNLIKRKGADLLPEIMKKLGPSYVLYYTAGLRSKVPEGFDFSNMKPLGKLSVDELIDEYNKCDALLFPTRLEGFGYAVAEAMACGKPVISTNISSIPEIVEDNINGYLCKIGHTSDYVGKIKLLVRNTKQQKKTMSINNRRKIQSNFDPPSLVKMFLSFYVGLI